MGRLATLVVLLIFVLVLASVPWFLRSAFPLNYRELIFEVAHSNDLDPFLIAAVIQVESGFRLEAASQKGALGLMQIMPETAVWLGTQRTETISPEDLFDPRINIGLGAYYLRYLIDRFPTEYAALAAYNAGPTNARRWLDEGLWDGSYERTGQIPYKETRDYVRKVIMMQNLFTLLYKE